MSLEHLKKNNLVTMRSTLLILLAIVLLFGPAIKQKDIIATIIALSLLFIILSFYILNIICVNKISKNLKIECYLKNEQDCFSEQVVKLVFKTTSIKLLPFFVLRLTPKFNYQLEHDCEVLIAGQTNYDRMAELMLTFPHRGCWTVIYVICHLEDRFGLSSQIIDVNCETTLKIRPPVKDFNNIPIASSFFTPGEEIFGENIRLGGLYDFKKYHPGDGVNKILWKTYAKSRELIARHPETSFSPEGQLAIYVIASKFDDELCSAALAYVNSAENIGLELVFGCLGSDAIVSHSEQAEQLLIKHIYDLAKNHELNYIDNFESYFHSVTQKLPGSQISQVVIFVSDNLLKNKLDYSKLLAIGSFLSAKGITPMFCFTIPSIDLPVVNKLSILKSLLTFQDHDNRKIALVYYQDFLNICLKNKWQVYV